MPVGFGFSVGDFISAIDLIRKVSKALKKTGGTATEYQHVVIELDGLQKILHVLQSIEPSANTIDHVHAIRAMALACQIPLRQFLDKIEGFERSMGPFSAIGSVRSSPRKVQWALHMSQETEKLRAVVGAKVMSINLLLSTYAADSLSKLQVTSSERHSEMLGHVAQHHAMLEATAGRVDELRTEIRHFRQVSEGNADRHLQSVDGLSARIKYVNDQATTIASSLKSSQDVGSQVADFINSFPVEIRGTLGNLLKANLENHSALLSIQSSITQLPCFSGTDSFRFTDGLGREFQLPYEWFHHWEPFEGWLRSSFKETPGYSKVLQGSYDILDIGNKGQSVQQEHWDWTIARGSVINMVMIMSFLDTRSGICPRCGNATPLESRQAATVVCPSCTLQYATQSVSLDHEIRDLSMVEEDEAVLLQQTTADCSRYGLREEPHDIEMTDTPDDKPQDVRISPLAEESQHAFDSMISQESPLERWLEQSALVAQGEPAIDRELREKDLSLLQGRQEEIAEIKVFKNVRVSLIAQQDAQTVAFDNVMDDCRVFYRNMLDRYPKMPPYLAQRLAVATSRTSQRLSKKRNEFADNEKVLLSIFSANPRPSAAFLEKISRTLPGISPRLAKIWFQNQRAKLMKLADEGRQLVYSQTATQFPMLKSVARVSDLEKCAAKELSQINTSLETIEENPLESESYWLDGFARPRSPESRSRSSSMNSSLKGPAVFDPTEQHPVFLSDRHIWESPNHRKRTNRKIRKPTYPLPSPPFGFGIGSSFQCDICLRTIYAQNMLQWKAHVFHDLRPYVCIWPTCSSPNAQYESRQALSKHQNSFVSICNCASYKQLSCPRFNFGSLCAPCASEEGFAPNESVSIYYPDNVQCPFCQQFVWACLRQKEGRRVYFRHVGRHMEEVSLSSTLWQEHTLDCDTASATSSMLGSFKCSELGCELILETRREMFEHQFTHLKWRTQ